MEEYNLAKDDNEILKVIPKINAFLYYNCKDSKGFGCAIEDNVLKTISKDINENKKIYERRIMKELKN